MSMSEPPVIFPPGTGGNPNPPVVCVPFKYGRKAIKTDSRTLKVRDYLTAALPAPPPSVDWTKGQTIWGMLANDSLGDCTIAGALHAIMGWALNIGNTVVFTDQDAINYYEDFDGYDPNDPSTDQGGVLLDVLQDWKKQGIKGHTVTLYASVNPSNVTEVQQALSLFGPLYCGMNFPNSAVGQPTWEVTDDNSIDGGHCVVMIGYNPTGPVFISWGALYQATWAFFAAYFDEIYAAISPDWFEQSGVDPTGLNLAQLQTDIGAIV